MRKIYIENMLGFFFGEETDVTCLPKGLRLFPATDGRVKVVRRFEKMRKRKSDHRQTRQVRKYSVNQIKEAKKSGAKIDTFQI